MDRGEKRQEEISKQERKRIQAGIDRSGDAKTQFKGKSGKRRGRKGGWPFSSLERNSGCEMPRGSTKGTP